MGTRRKPETAGDSSAVRWETVRTRRGESHRYRDTTTGRFISARQVRAAMPECVLVFLEPPSPEELKRRLVGRGTEDEAAVRARLERADAELAAVGEFDHVVRNVDVETAASELSALVPKRQM